jgi:hypothetical protein
MSTRKQYSVDKLFFAEYSTALFAIRFLIATFCGDEDV